jgi:ATPase subunit of ABC transporter with duplicated ATPase domains
MNQSIIVHTLKFHINETTLELSLSLGMEKTGLVGKNGTGKTTLLRLLMHELQPLSGTITTNATVSYMPQDYQFNLNQSVAAALGIDQKLKAIDQLKNDAQDESLLAIVGADWDIEHRAITMLQSFGLPQVLLKTKLRTLSGGERMKVALAGLFLFPDRYIIMDEPTNNLDVQSRQLLYAHIANWKSGMLVVSHDRQLLDLMDQIAELTPAGLRMCGGNYTAYETAKQNAQETSVRLFATAQQEFKKIKKQAQDVRERQEKRVSHAKKRAATQNIPKIILNAMKRAGERTTGKLKILHDERVAGAHDRLAKAKENILPENQIHVELSRTEVPKGKLMVECKEMSFAYPNASPILENISFSIYGQERVAIAGANGTGKTTLVRLLLSQLRPNTGKIKLGTEAIAYLDQEVHLLKPSETVLANVMRIANLNDHTAREWLSSFLFYKKEVFKTVSQLSGGERIRAGLAAILAGDTPAQLLVLDEPTNNLDLDSIEKIESALMGYKGNLVVISHDQTFLNNIGIERHITLE